MSPLPRLAVAEAPLPPTTVCLRRQRGRPRLGLGYCSASAQPLEVASSGTPVLLASRRHHSSVAVPSSSSLRFAQRRASGGRGLLILTFAASAVAVSSWFILFSSIRSMLACKTEAESLEKSFDSARAKLPETMASVRIVGKDVSDLAVDLSDLSQELRKGVQSSTSVVHMAEAQLRQLATSVPQGSAQRTANQKKAAADPLLASTVRELRELIADIRSGFGVASSVASLLAWAPNFGSKRPKNLS